VAVKVADAGLVVVLVVLAALVEAWRRVAAGVRRTEVRRILDNIAAGQ
jgi:hypothetical protein